MKRRVVVAFVFLVARLSAAQVPGTQSSGLDSTSNPSYSIFVQSLTNGTIYRKDSQSGSFEPFLTGLGEPVDVILGPGGALGTLYVLPHRNGPVRRYDPCSGEFLGTFGDAASVHAHSLQFGPDGRLYILEAGGPVNLYDGQTGAAVMPPFVAGPFTDADHTEFGPGGSFFVADWGGFKLLRYDAAGSPSPTAGFPGAVFAQGGPLDKPSPLEIDASGRIYVGSWTSGEILRYDATTGGYLGVAANGISGPSDLRFAPDGTLYVMGGGNGRLFQLNGTTLTDVTSDLPAGGDALEIGPGAMACRGVTQVPTLSGPAFVVFAALLATGGALLLRRRRA
jgi:outer membrane protein assembly factor BamB